MLTGYSGTPLAKKLGIRAGSVLVLFDAPDGFVQTLEPEAVGFLISAGEEKSDVAVLFAESEARLLKLLEEAIPAIKINGGLWIAWPKKASKVPTDVTENRLRDILLPKGLVDNKVCAIDEKWSGLRFVWRVELR